MGMCGNATIRDRAHIKSVNDGIRVLWVINTDGHRGLWLNE